MLHYIHSIPLTPITILEINYGCYWTGHSLNASSGVVKTYASVDDMPNVF